MSESRLRVNRLQLATILGCLPEERTAPRPVLVDLSVKTDIARAAATDDIADALDLRRLHDIATAAARTNPRLIETLATTIAIRILALPGVQSVTVHIEKPASLPNTHSTSIELTLP